MKKCIIHSLKGFTSIIEIECEVLSRSECPFPFLHDGEYAVKILAPQTLCDKLVDGKLAPAIWCSWALYDSVEECLSIHERDTRASLLRTRRKQKLQDVSVVASVSDEEIVETMSQVKIVKLV